MGILPSSQSAAARLAIVGQLAARATANLPQTAAGNIFTITGGRILLTALVGEVTTAIQAQLTNTKIQMVPTVGATTDLSAVVDIASLAVGSWLSLPDPPATGSALVKTAVGTTSYVTKPGPTVPVMLPAGAIALNCAASSTGQIKWSLTWIPLDDGASVAAA